MADPQKPQEQKEAKTTGDLLDLIALKKGVDQTKARKEYAERHGGVEALKAEIATQQDRDKLRAEMEKEMDKEPDNKNMEESDEKPPAYSKKLKSRTKVEEELAKLPGIESVENVSDLRKLSTDTLIKLEEKYEGVLMYAFTDIIDENQSEEKVDFANWGGYREPKAGTKLHVNFHDNQDAEMHLGAADIFPPSIRKITVYPNGNKENTRTSEHRAGLKGRNQKNEGFYDKHGYIPIFSMDIVIIGGEQEPEKNIDANFATQFLNALGKLDESSYEKYKTSDEAKVDETFLKKLEAENPNFQKRKTISSEEISQIMERVETTGSGKRVVDTGLKILSGEMERYIPEHCGDWVENVYRRAGVRQKEVWHNYSYYKPENEKLSPEKEEEMINIIQPGDWLWYFNNNGAGLGKNGESLGKIWENAHSAIFVEWIDKENRIAKIMNANRGKAPTDTGIVDLSGAKEGVTYEEMCKGDKKNNIRAKRPITRIAKPIDR